MAPMDVFWSHEMGVMFRDLPPSGRYPALYHQTMAALALQDIIPDDARRMTAQLLRSYRLWCTKAHVCELKGRIVKIGWPTRERPNGTLR